MKSLKANWAQMVCWLVVVCALGWAAYTVYASGLDNTKQEDALKAAKSDIKNLDGQIEQNQYPEVLRLLSTKPSMLPEKPSDPAAPATNINLPNRPWYPDGTPVQTIKADAPPPPPPGGGDETKNVTVNAFILPPHLEAFQVYDGNELIVYLPWPEERSMTAITGFQVQRLEMRNANANGWVAKTGVWENLPKYMVADEAKAGAAAEVPVAPPVGGPAAPRVRPAGLGGLGGVGGGGGLGGAGGLPGTGPAATTPTLDMKKYQGVYVLFDAATMNDETRYVYRVAAIGKLLADCAGTKEFTVDNVKYNVKTEVPAAISSVYTTPDKVALTVFAPGETVTPTTTGKIQVKFVTPPAADDATKTASFIVMRGLSQSKIKPVPAGQEITAELTVFNAKGLPIPGPEGILKENVSTGLVFDHVETDDATKKDYAVLLDAKKVAVKIEQGKTNGNPKEPEVDLVLLNKIMNARADEYKKMFNTTWEKSDATVPVPAKSMSELKGDLNLTPNQYYPSKDDDLSPSSTWPDVTVAPREHKIIRIPVTPRPTPVVTTPIRPAVTAPTPSPYQPPVPGGPMGPGGPGGMGGPGGAADPGGRDRTIQERDRSEMPPPK